MKVIVVGCTHAGIAAIKQILKTYPDAEITAYERQASISYLSCATYLHIEGTVEDLSAALYAEPADFVKQGVNMKVEHDVIRIDTMAHTVRVQNLVTREMFTDHYDKLIMTTGSITAIPAITGIENPKVLLCKTYDQANNLCESTIDAKKIAIIGGGYVGVELAEGYANTGREVVLIQQTAHVLDKYIEPLIANQVMDVLADHGVKVVLSTQVSAFEDTEDGSLMVRTNSGDFEVDMAAMSAGMIPYTDLLDGKVDMADNGAIVVDDYAQTSDPDILAAGDAALSHYNPTRGMIYTPLASQAVRQGALAGINVGERRLRTLGTQATTGMFVFKHTIVTTGLTMDAAQDAKLNAAMAVYQGNYRPEFMPNAYPVTVVLVYDRNNRHILGAQLMSQHDVSQAANTVSALIQTESTIDQLAFLDMLFSPSFNQPFNYLNLVAQIAVEQEHGYLRT